MNFHFSIFDLIWRNLKQAGGLLLSVAYFDDVLSVDGGFKILGCTVESLLMYPEITLPVKCFSCALIGATTALKQHSCAKNILLSYILPYRSVPRTQEHSRTFSIVLCTIDHSSSNGINTALANVPKSIFLLRGIPAAACFIYPRKFFIRCITRVHVIVPSKQKDLFL